jgi:hypothetical protein
VKNFEDNFSIPAGLSPKGKAAAEVILQVLKKDGADASGGCRVFYTPAEWKARGEQFGTNSELVVVYDGGDHAIYFDYDHECYSAIDKMADALRPVGVFTEACTGWYSAVYT